MALAPKPLTLSFVSPFPTPHPFLNPKHKPLFPNLHSQKLPTLIICKSTQTDIPDSPVSTPEFDGSGPSAPTRGEIFLQRHQSSAASATVLAEIKKKKKNKDKGVKASASTVPSCYGCGAPLQTSVSDAPGYVEPDTYSLKKKHRQLRTVLCGRCKLLSHGHMITAVGGNGGYSGGKQFVTAEELREKLSHLRHEKALIVKLVDIVDFNGSFLARIRDLAGANPIILVELTKVDLLPKGTDFNCVGDWVVEATLKKKLNVLTVHLTSSKSLVGIAGVVSEIQKEKKGRDVYILGSANVGKSAFINALLKMLSYKDPVAAAARKYKPIQSAVPELHWKVYDTPGVHLHHRQAAVINSEDLPALAPQSRLEANHSQYVLPETRLTFYGPKALQLHVVPTEVADEFYQKEVGVLLTPNWKTEGRQLDGPACDVAISGLGWISVEPFGQSVKSSESSFVEASGEIGLVVHVPKPVEIFVRPPLPVGSAGGEWYQYRELTEIEQEVRPKWCDDRYTGPSKFTVSVYICVL
ncbi:hypothetical protein DH2020_034052 [Rehmannia glutinosa]|uniref:Uncharacterized protein n=1 Tax=Rehmannia glutinosa TaxID=99300 RepID=A0ABR0VDN0_REHGL